LSGPLHHTATLSDGREFSVVIPEEGDRLLFGFLDGTALAATSTDALTIGLALQHAAVQVGQREAHRRDMKTAARDRDETRRRLAAAGKVPR
jgi:hypothetical protein